MDQTNEVSHQMYSPATPAKFPWRAIENENVSFFFGGLGIAHCRQGYGWYTSMLENTGSPADHNNEHTLEIRAYRGKQNTNKWTQLPPINLPSFNKGTRSLRFDLSTIVGADITNGSDTTNHYFKHLGDFADFEAGKKVKIARHPACKLTNIFIPGGIGYSAEFARDKNGNPEKYRFRSSTWTGPDRFLGQWLGVDLRATGGRIKLMEIGDQSESEIWSAEVPTGSQESLVFIVDNECENCGNMIDFPYFYNTAVNGNGSKGIIHPRAKVDLDFAKKSLLNRVACNMMYVSDYEVNANNPGSSFFDAILHTP